MLASAAAVLAAQPDYFPLHVGNQWVYRGTALGNRGDTTLVLQIPRAAEFNGQRYWLLEGLPSGEYWLRMDSSGTLLAYDPARNVEEPWYVFQTAEGESYRTSLPGVPGSGARIQSRKAAYKGPIGEVDYALEITYPGTFQVGIERELFLPYIGMVRRTQAIGGPNYMVYDLVYSRTGGVTVVAAPELSFTLTLDQSLYTANLMPPVDPRAAVPVMTARLTLRNTTSRPVQMTFPTGQDYDLVLKNEQGEVVYRWSLGKPFTLAIRDLSFGPGEKNWVILAPLGSADRPFPAGKYVAEAWLATMGQGQRAWSASAGFELRHVF